MARIKVTEDDKLRIANGIYGACNCCALSQFQGISLIKTTAHAKQLIKQAQYRRNTVQYILVATNPNQTKSVGPFLKKAGFEKLKEIERLRHHRPVGKKVTIWGFQADEDTK